MFMSEMDTVSSYSQANINIQFLVGAQNMPRATIAPKNLS